jgi:hypothetical protein
MKTERIQGKNHESRRNFVKKGLLLTGGILAAPAINMLISGCSHKGLKKITIDSVSSAFEDEPFTRPFILRGNNMNEVWLTVSFLKSKSGIHSTGLSVQNILWSDPLVFMAHSSDHCNALMYSLTDTALRLMKDHTFTYPSEIFDLILQRVYDTGKRLTSNPDLGMAFALNAMAGPDNAAWLLFASENHITNFDDLIPPDYRDSFSLRPEKVAEMVHLGYEVPAGEIRSAADAGFFIFSIMAGQPGSQEEMLAKDMARLSEIHEALEGFSTENSKSGKIIYCIECNGRYESRENLIALLDHARDIGALDHILFIEDPFPRNSDINVSDIPVRITADESILTAGDAEKMIATGYRGIALKPSSATLSMTLKIAQLANRNNIPCYCLNRVGIPILAEWDKNVAARVKGFEELKGAGLLGNDSIQYFKYWQQLLEDHPDRNASWVGAKNGCYELNRKFYANGGGIFSKIHRFEQMFERK